MKTAHALASMILLLAPPAWGQSILYPSTTDTLLSIGTPSPAPVVVVTPPPTIVVAPSTSSSSPSTTTICTTAGSITYCTH